VHWFDRSPSLRSGRLAATVALRATGVVPFLIAFGWLLFAVGQEPRMLRLFGIQLVLHASWVAAAAAFLVTMARLPISRRIVPQLVAATSLVIAVGVASTVAFAGLEWLRGGTAELRGLTSISLAFLLTWLPVGLCTSLVAVGMGGGARARWVGWATWLAHLLAAATLSIPHVVGDWSLRSIAASMACLASALAFAHIYGQKKV
jgi:hypothetical protein